MNIMQIYRATMTLFNTDNWVLCGAWSIHIRHLWPWNSSGIITSAFSTRALSLFTQSHHPTFLTSRLIIFKALFTTKYQGHKTKYFFTVRIVFNSFTDRELHCHQLTLSGARNYCDKQPQPFQVHQKYRRGFLHVHAYIQSSLALGFIASGHRPAVGWNGCYISWKTEEWRRSIWRMLKHSRIWVPGKAWRGYFWVGVMQITVESWTKASPVRSTKQDLNRMHLLLPWKRSSCTMKKMV